MYGRLKALSDVSFRIERGEVVGVLGPNGAGKTTLMRILAGYFPSTSGLVEIAGMDMAKNPREIQRMIGYLPETAPLYKELTALEMLTFSARMRGVKRSVARKEVDRAIETCGLSVAVRRVIGTLSKGFRQRVALAAALVGSPRAA
jgi:ABC-2 type transport system ATP-binding protein